MIALLVPEISPGVGFCDEDGRTRTEELGILVVGWMDVTCPKIS